MAAKIANLRAGDLVARIKCALGNSQHDDIDASDVLDRVTEHNVDAVKPFLRDLLTHHDWVVRADAVELVGAFHVREFLRDVKARLRDSNSLVREYALWAYYDLLGAEALSLLKSVSKDRSVSFRVVAFVLRYIETKDEAVLKELRRILMMKRCRFANRYAALRTFDAYANVGLCPEIIQLFEEILSRLAEAPRKYGLDKDIPARLRRWKRSARKQRRDLDARL